MYTNSLQTPCSVCEPPYLPKQLLKQCPRQAVPCNGVCNGCKYPVQFPQWCFAVCLSAWYSIYEFFSNAVMPQQCSAAEPSQGHFDRSGQAGSEHISWQVGMLQQHSNNMREFCNANLLLASRQI